MSDASATHSWFASSLAETPTEPTQGPNEFVRLWQGFMTARLTVAALLAVLQTSLYILSSAHSKAVLAISLAYFAATVAARRYAKPHDLGNAFNVTWLFLAGLDVLAFLALQVLQGGSINYTPLCVLPILLTAVLGTVRLALGTAAFITMLLLGGTLWTYLATPGDVTPYLVQSALSSAGGFVIALLASQLTTHLAREGQRARTSQLAARIQRQVNELVIESLPDGVLIVDDKGCVRAANPAARSLLGSQRALNANVFYLREEPGWASLLTLTRLSIGTGQSQLEEVSIHHAGHGPLRVRARTRLAATQGVDGESLCVLFLQDQRELEARVRTDKLASMGRMSTAVAHEIRNPLAAITQANALLDEDLSDPRQKALTKMVHQNARRLDRIVDDILKVSRVAPDDALQTPATVALDEWSAQVCQDWAAQNHCQEQLTLALNAPGLAVCFDGDHLRRVLVNLLDNARRYASGGAQSIQVRSGVLDSQQVFLSVWSNGAPMERSVERHLFEPFFSSESRSTGLGLYICRELCERYGASVAYQRMPLVTQDAVAEGNAFVITLQRTDALPPPPLQTVPASL